MANYLKILLVTSALIAFAIWMPGAPTFNNAYTTVANAATPLTKRPMLNFVNGGCVDNSGANRTDCTVTGGGGGSGTVTNIATTSPLSGGPISTTGTLTCPTCVVTTGSYNNPTWITALAPSKVGNGTPQWNASSFQGFGVSVSTPTSGQVMSYNTGTNLWTPTSLPGGPAANPANEVTTTFSATPTFTCGSSTAGTVTSFKLSTALTANITSSTLATCTAGQNLNFDFLQDGTGGRTVVMPSGFDSPALSPTASTHTKCGYWYDGTNGKLIGCSADATASLIQGVERAAPSTPPVSAFSCWADSTDHFGLECTANNSSTVYVMVPKVGTTVSGSSCTVKAVTNGIITSATCP